MKKGKENILILGINGSPHKDGHCARLLERAPESCEKNGAKTKIIHLIDREKEFFHSYLSRKPEKDFVKLRKEILGSNGFILATPVNWINVSTLMKNFIDKLTVLEEQGFLLENKVAGFIVAENEGGAWEAIQDMAIPLNHMGALTPPYAMMFHNKTLAKQKISRWMDRDIPLLGKNMVTMCRMIKSAKPYWGHEK